MSTQIAHRQRSWLKDNFIGLILLAMVAAYFVDFQDFKIEQRRIANDLEKRVKDVEIGTALNEYDIRDMRKRVDELCKNYTDLYFKINSRSGNIIKK